MTFDPRLIGELRQIVGEAQVLTERDLTERYRGDWTGRFIANSTVVVRPADTEQVAGVIRACADHGQAVVPQGGNTGLVGGSVPLSGEVVISTERLVGVEDASGRTGHLTALAGTPLTAVQAAARELGWEYAVDLAARDSATIGGTIATNAGGLRVARYGDTRAQVVGVEVVTGSGEVISDLGGTLRNNIGYHLPSLLTGSEGTLGVLTSARVRLVPHFAQRATALMRFDVRSDAPENAEALHRLLPDVESIEVFFGEGLELVASVFDLPTPFSTVDGGYLLVEVADNRDPLPTLTDASAALSGVGDVAVAQNSTASSKLWRYRELHTEAIATLGAVHKLDVAVPPGSLAEFMARVPDVVNALAPTAQTWLFGHGGESAVHVNVTGIDADDHNVDDAVLELVAEMNGSISAEHGIGRAKLPLIGLARSEAELRVLGGVKAAFDPSGIMNPYVLLPRSDRSPSDTPT